MASTSLKFTSGDWADALRAVRRVSNTTKTAIDASLREEAERAADLVRQQLQSGGRMAGKPFEPNTPNTLLGKRGRKPLQDTGALLESIGVIKSGNVYFVGPRKGTHPKNSRITLSKLAEIHEYGARIAVRWTERSRRAFFHLLQKTAGRGRPYVERDYSPKRNRTGGGVLLVKIPARPFLRPVQKRWYTGTAAEQAKARVAKRFWDRVKT